MPHRGEVFFGDVASHEVIGSLPQLALPVPKTYHLLVACALPSLTSSGVICVFLFSFFCRVSSQMKKPKVLKNLRMSCLKHKVKPRPHAWCCLSAVLWKLQELGHWTVSQPSVISWEVVCLVRSFSRVVTDVRLSLGS